MLTSHVSSALQQCLETAENAVSHDVVCGALRRLSLYVVATTGHDVTSIFTSLEWEKSIQRYKLVYTSKYEYRFTRSVASCCKTSVERQSLRRYLTSAGRFLLTIPSSSADETLLRHLLQFLLALLDACSPAPASLLSWLCELLHSGQGALLDMLGKAEPPEDATEGVLLARRQLNRVLLKFVKVYVAKNPYSLANR